LLDDMCQTIGSDAEVVWVNGERVLEAGVQPWSELPLWLPADDYAGMARADISRALAAGLTFRPVAETIADTLAWDRNEPGDRPTLAHDKEQKILAAR
jgi:2'-hydroxyisoflavone reductase